MADVVLGTGYERVSIALLRRLHPSSPNEFERGWLAVTVDVRTGGFAGKAEAGVHVEELRRFGRDLQRLHDRLAGEARLVSVEGWFDLALVGDGSGAVTLSGTVRDRPDGRQRNELRFRLHLDQSYLPDAVESLTALVDSA